MATLSASRPCCPIRLDSVHLLCTAGDLLRVLFFDQQAARLPRSQWAHQLPAALRAAGGGADPGLQSVDRAWAPGRGAGALRRLRLVRPAPGWDRLSRGQVGASAAAFIRQVMAQPAGTLFRHCVAGDQWPDPADPLRIDQALLLKLARATRHLRAAWSYTHFPMEPANQATLRLAASKGLVVNASTESRSMAAALVRQGIPAVCVVPPDAPAVFAMRACASWPAPPAAAAARCSASAAECSSFLEPNPTAGLHRSGVRRNEGRA